MQIFSFLCLRICFIRWRINWNLFKFIGPFTVPITSYMKITNPTETKVAYKIKTTAPKKYCVRPNGGVLDPEQSVEIAGKLFFICTYYWGVILLE